MIAEEQFKDITHFKLGMVSNLVADNPEMYCLNEDDEKQIFGEGKTSVFLLQHNDMLSWVSVVPILCEFITRMSNKYNHKIYPFTLFHKSVVTTPIVKDISKHYIGNSVTSYEEIVDVLENVPGAFFGTCPEGANCNFDYGSPIAEFSTLGLIKAGLATDANIVIFTVKQDDPLSVTIPVPGIKVLKRGAKGIKIPFFRRTHIEGVLEVYPKPISKDDFNSMTKEEQRNVVTETARDVSVKMLNRYNSI